MRFVLVASLCLLPAAGFAASDTCGVTAEIVNTLTAERRDGKSAEQAMQAALDTHGDQPSNILQTIPTLAQIVYEYVTAEQLTGDVGSAYRDQCEAKLAQ